MDKRLVSLLAYRIEQAKASLREASILFDADSYRGAVNRAYYAMFYATLAVLATKQLGSSKHSGIISLFDREFVKTGRFQREQSKSLHLAFDMRQTYDYGELVEVDETDVRRAIGNASDFVSTICDYLKSMNIDV